SDLYDFAPVGYLTINQDARITQANLTAATMLGIERHRLVGQRFALFVQRESQDDLYLALRAGPPDGRSWSGEILLRKADCTALPVSIEMASVVEPDRGRFWRCVLSDITNKKSAEEARRRYAAIVEYSNDAILSADLDGRLVSWNPAAERMFGYTEAEVAGKSVALLVSPEMRDEQLRILHRLRNGEHLDHYETVRVTKA